MLTPAVSIVASFIPCPCGCKNMVMWPVEEGSYIYWIGHKMQYWYPIILRFYLIINKTSHLGAYVIIIDYIMEVIASSLFCITFSVLPRCGLEENTISVMEYVIMEKKIIWINP